MLRKFVLLAPVLFGATLLQAAAVTACPTTVISAGGLSVPAPVFSQDSNGVCTFQSTAGTPYFTSSLAAINSVNLTAFGDPYIDYAFAVDNVSTSTQIFTFSLTEPYVGGPYNTLTNSFSDSVTDGGPTPNGSVTIGRVGTSAFVEQVTINGVNVDGIDTGCTVTGTPGFSSPGCEKSPDLDTVKLSAPASGTLAVTIAFSLSPGDEYSFTGQAQLTNASAIPEPASWFGMIIGLAAVVGLAYRRRAAKGLGEL